MAKSRPFAYNPGSQIPGTQKFGNLTVGSHDLTPDQSGVQWWNGPDEDLGYVIAQTNVDGFGNPLQPTQIPNVYGSVGFFRTDGKNTTAFINLTNAISGQNFTTATQCKTWLESNNRWTSWSDFATEAIVAFKARVLSDGGNFEAETNLENQLNTLGSTLFDSASLIITPNAYKEQTLYSIKPDKVGTNLLLYSQDWSQSVWYKGSATIISSTRTAPDGTSTATELSDVGASGIPSVPTQNYLISPSTSIVYSIYTKAVSLTSNGTRIFLLRNSTTSTNFNALSFNYSSTGNLGNGWFSESVGNGWFRLSYSRTTGISIGDSLSIYYGRTSGAAVGATDVWQVWGAQVDTSTTAGTYIPTTDRAIINGTIGDMRVTRATTATRVNSDGLIEVVPYNLLQQSQTFNTWNNQNAVITSNVITSPNGTFTGSKLSANNTLNQHRIYNMFNFVGQGVLSVYAKAGEYNFLSLARGGGTQGQNISFDLLNGTIIGTDGTFIPAIEDVGDGWYRCSISSSSMGAGENLSYWIMVRESPTTASYTGDGISGIYIWGAQLVQGTEPKPYQLTANRLNVPRIDYITGQPVILVEPQRTNLLLRSEEFDNVYWYKAYSTINTNTTISPSGMQDADTITTTDTFNVVAQTITVTANTTYTFSFYVLRGSMTDLKYSVYNLSGKSNIIAPTSYYSQTSTSNWVRVSVTFTTPEGCTSINIYPIRDTGSMGTVFLWGAQLEAGSNATSYIPTTTSSVTRNADVISNTNAGTVIGQSEGTIFLEFIPKVLNSDIARICDKNSPYSDGFFIFISPGGNLQCIIRASGSFVVNSTIAVNISNTPVYKVVLKYSSGNIKIFVNGFLRSTHTATYTFSSLLNGVFLDNAQWTSSNQTRGINTLALWKTQITDAQAIQLTTL